PGKTSKMTKVDGPRLLVSGAADGPVPSRKLQGDPDRSATATGPAVRSTEHRRGTAQPSLVKVRVRPRRGGGRPIDLTRSTRRTRGRSEPGLAGRPPRERDATCQARRPLAADPLRLGRGSRPRPAG